MVRARKYVVTKRFEGKPKRSDYEIVEYELPPLKDGEILVKTEYVSVDPLQRGYKPDSVEHSVKYDTTTLPYDQLGYQVGIVKESRDQEFPVGTRVVSQLGWSDYNIIKTKNQSRNPMTVAYKAPDLKGLSPSLAVGAVGMPGATAYIAFLEYCKPKPGDTVVVTGAAGAVGALVGQIAKIKGCRVIGFAGSDEKVQLLINELGYDAAFNYKTADIAKVLKQAAPNGVDSYFDNVGGEISSIIMNQMNDHGRVTVIGAISSYNTDATTLPKASILQPTILYHRLKVEGYIIFDDFERWPEVFEVLVDWIKSGKLKAPEHVTQGFDKIYDAFVGMLAGENFGKAVVKL